MTPKSEDSVTAERETLLNALRNIIAHTAYLPGAPRDLLEGLLASCERIARAALDGPVLSRAAPESPPIDWDRLAHMCWQLHVHRRHHPAPHCTECDVLAGLVADELQVRAGASGGQEARYYLDTVLARIEALTEERGGELFDMWAGEVPGNWRQQLFLSLTTEAERYRGGEPASRSVAPDGAPKCNCAPESDHVGNIYHQRHCAMLSRASRSPERP